MSEPKLTPMLQQYFEVKRGLPKGTLLLFRLGDFYELFFEDAIEASKLLGLTLTRRQEHPMAGLPFHAHEVFEERWRQCAGEQRCAWRSLAQWAAALTHAARGNTTGARSMAQRAAESLLACETTVAIRSAAGAVEHPAIREQDVIRHRWPLSMPGRRLPARAPRF